MFRRQLWRALLLTGVCWSMGASFTAAQLYTMTPPAKELGGDLTSLRALETVNLDAAIFQFNSEHESPLEDAGNAVSRLDLAAPKNARKEYDKGYLHLIRKQLQ